MCSVYFVQTYVLLLIMTTLTLTFRVSVCKEVGQEISLHGAHFLK
jgi:hypothetical protein